MKIVILDGDRVNQDGLSWEPITALGECTIYPHTSKDELAYRIEDAEIVLSCSVPLKAPILEKAKKLKLISLFATGFNHIDIDYCKANQIAVCNVPNYSTASVVQMSMALLLGLCNRVETHSQHVHQKEWGNGWNHYGHLPIELSNKNLGIIGYGEIGKGVEKAAKALGMEVYIWDRENKHPNESNFVSLETLLKTSDVISLHAPLTQQNRHLINEKTIELMKDHMMIINTARGPLMDENAVARAILSGKIAGIGVDVLSKEPPSADHPFFGLKEVLMTPHAAWASKEARVRLIEENGKNISEFLAGNDYHRLDR